MVRIQQPINHNVVVSKPPRFSANPLNPYAYTGPVDLELPSHNKTQSTPREPSIASWIYVGVIVLVTLGLHINDTVNPTVNQPDPMITAGVR